MYTSLNNKSYLAVPVPTAVATAPTVAHVEDTSPLLQAKPAKVIYYQKKEINSTLSCIFIMN